MSETPETYIVIRNWEYLKRYNEQPPGQVMRLVKETDASLMGEIVDRSGKIGWQYAGYDTNPTVETRGYGADAKRVTTRRGRVLKERAISRHASLEEAWAALDRAVAAWKGAEDETAYAAACQASAAARRALHAEQERLAAEAQRVLASLHEAERNVHEAERQARREMYARMSEAAAQAAAQTEQATAA